MLSSPSVVPLSDELGSSLFGVAADPLRLTDPLSDPGGARDIHPYADETSSARESGLYTLGVVALSAVVFVTIIALYDLAKTSISLVFATRALADDASPRSPAETVELRKVNHAAWTSSAVFSVFCVVTAAVLVPLLLGFIRRSNKRQQHRKIDSQLLLHDAFPCHALRKTDNRQDKSG